MRLSRTARFLIAALLVAAAAFVWVNFFNQSQVREQPVLAGTARPAPIDVTGAQGAAGDSAGQPLAVTPDGPGGGETAGQPLAVTSSPAAAESAAEGDASQAAGDQPAPVDPGAVTAPPVVVAEGVQVVTRDLVVEDLPFLVLAPPAPGEEDAAALGAAASRPQGTQRVTINPFSPVVVRTPAATPQQVVAQAEPPASSTPIVEVRADGAPPAQTVAQATPAAPPEPVRAPAPRTVAPGGPVSAELPRALPSGMLPTTPQILRDARSAPAVVEPVAPDIGDLAALRVPGDEAGVVVAPVDAELATAAATVPDPLGPGRPLSQPVQTVRPQAPTAPLAAGADPLSRYLRDNDVRFTGTVLGPLSVGVFRSNLYSVPVVITLGQTLPDTDIVLSDLRGYEARFTQGDRTQTLSLDLRR